MSFRDAIRELSPPWLQRTWGERFMYVPGVILDVIAEWALQGIQARFPHADREDHLALLGRDRRIVRGFNEPAGAYRERLRRWLDYHQIAGNPFAMMEQLRGYLTGFAVRIRTVNERGTWHTIHPDGSYEIHRKEANWNWDGRYPASSTRRFWVIIYPLATGLWSTEGTWGDGLVRWGDAGTWGTTASREQIDSIRQIVKDGAPPQSRCPFIIVAFDDASFDPEDPAGAPLPVGEWGQYSKAVAGVRRPSRLRTARYWRGTV